MAVAAAPSLDDLFELGRAEAALTRPELGVAEGDISEMAIMGGATMADHVAGYAAAEIKAMFLDGAEGQKLTDLVFDRTGILRNPATTPVGVIQVTKAFPGIAYTIPAGSFVTTEPDANGVKQRAYLDVDVVWNLDEVGVKDVACTGASVGPEGNVGALGFVRFENGALTVAGFTVGNGERFAGGSPEESDPDLRARARDFYRTLRRGTLAALEFGAKVVPSCRRATAVAERSLITGKKTGLVFLYVADADGTSNDAMTAAVALEMINWTAAGDNVQVLAGAQLLLPISLTLTVRAGLAVDVIVANVKNLIVARLNRLKAGETCYRSQIKQAAMNVDPENILECTVVSPAADVAPDANELIRTLTTIITVA